MVSGPPPYLNRKKKNQLLRTASPPSLSLSFFFSFSLSETLFEKILNIKKIGLKAKQNALNEPTRMMPLQSERAILFCVFVC